MRVHTREQTAQSITAERDSLQPRDTSAPVARPRSTCSKKDPGTQRYSTCTGRHGARAVREEGPHTAPAPTPPPCCVQEHPRARAEGPRGQRSAPHPDTARSRGCRRRGPPPPSAPRAPWAGPAPSPRSSTSSPPAPPHTRPSTSRGTVGHVGQARAIGWHAWTQLHMRVHSSAGVLGTGNEDRIRTERVRAWRSAVVLMKPHSAKPRHRLASTLKKQDGRATVPLRPR